MNTSGLQKSGLIIFTTGFLAFNLIFFWSDYKLSPQLAASYITDPVRAESFQQQFPLLDKKINSHFLLVHELKETFDRVNQKQLEQYGISPLEVDRIVEQNTATPIIFSINTIETAIPGEDDVAVFKKKSFRTYGSRLEEQHFRSTDELRTQLEGVVNTIRKYEIINRFGFDPYRTKDLTYSLTKAATLGLVRTHSAALLMLILGLCIGGALLYMIPKMKTLPGIRNNGTFFHPMKTTKWLGILTGTWLIVFYIILYLYPEYLTNWVILVDPVSQLLSGHEAGRFFLYGFLYTLCILVMGGRMIIHYRHNKYQLIRTVSVMFFQTAFAFLIPELLIRLNQPYFDFKNIWPLDYDFFFDTELKKLIENGNVGLFMLGWGIALTLLGVPLFTYFFGKRWYCSWVCGCGGLAETLGDPYRHLSNKSLKAWKVERWMIHSVLVWAVVMTASVLYTSWTGSSRFLFIDSYTLREAYGFWIGVGFAGVVGTGFYPFMGNRVWCRFGCPLAAYLGLIQRFKSRFRITTNGGQCISCGNCSTYCEMGIDVRAYAQKGQNIIRSSCVGCGICSAVCPRGVLNLENRHEKDRFGEPVLLGNNNIVIHK